MPGNVQNALIILLSTQAAEIPQSPTLDKIGTNYIGLSKRRFSKRLSEHRDYPKAGKVEKPSGHHFSLPGHAVSNLQGLAIEHVRNRDPFVLKAREAFLIQKFDSFRNGLNQEP